MLRAVTDLTRVYDVLSGPLTREQLDRQYLTARDRGRRASGPVPDEPGRPISRLAAAVPVAANLYVAVHALHVLPPTGSAGIDLHLVELIHEDAGVALCLCDRALELDGSSHGYLATEWRPTVHDVATAIITAARVDDEPPSIVSCAQDAVSWLARAIADLDHDDPDSAAAISETLGRLLALSLFAETALRAASGGSKSP